MDPFRLMVWVKKDYSYTIVKLKKRSLEYLLTVLIVSVCRMVVYLRWSLFRDLRCSPWVVILLLRSSNRLLRDYSLNVLNLRSWTYPQVLNLISDEVPFDFVGHENKSDQVFTRWNLSSCLKNQSVLSTKTAQKSVHFCSKKQ